MRALFIGGGRYLDLQLLAFGETPPDKNVRDLKLEGQLSFSLDAFLGKNITKPNIANAIC